MYSYLHIRFRFRSTGRLCTRCAKQHTVSFIARGFAFVRLYGIVPQLKIILLRVRSAAFCSVHPYFDEMSVISVFVISEDFFQLIIIIFIIVEIIVILSCCISVFIIISVAVVMNVPG